MQNIEKTNKPFFIMMIGLSGSGKSVMSNKIKDTYSQSNSFVILNSDNLREELLNNVNDQSNNELIFTTMQKRTLQYLAQKISVIYDATNLCIKDRKQVLEKIQKVDCYKIAYVMSTPFEQCKAQNLLRDRTVPEEVITKQRLRFQFPLYGEGFDVIDIDGWYSVLLNYTNVSFNAKHLQDTLKLMDHFEQKTHYHDFTLLEHELRTYNFLKEKIKNRQDKNYLLQACLIHDIGKLYTQTINKIGECSYYGHANVGTYSLLQNLDCLNVQSFTDIIKCLCLVNYHMEMFDLEKAKSSTVEKKKRLFGKELYQDLILLHEADKVSCKKEKEETKNV